MRLSLRRVGKDWGKQDGWPLTWPLGNTVSCSLGTKQKNTTETGLDYPNLSNKKFLFLIFHCKTFCYGLHCELWSTPKTPTPSLFDICRSELIRWGPFTMTLVLTKSRWSHHLFFRSTNINSITRAYKKRVDGYGPGEGIRGRPKGLILDQAVL